jgi:hypothetical protein
MSEIRAQNDSDDSRWLHMHICMGQCRIPFRENSAQHHNRNTQEVQIWDGCNEPPTTNEWWLGAATNLHFICVETACGLKFITNCSNIIQLLTFVEVNVRIYRSKIYDIYRGRTRGKYNTFRNELHPYINRNESHNCLIIWNCY